VSLYIYNLYYLLTMQSINAITNSFILQARHYAHEIRLLNSLELFFFICKNTFFVPVFEFVDNLFLFLDY